MTIAGLKAGRKTYSCTLDTGDSIDLSVETVSRFSLCQGKELSRSQYERILSFERLQRTVEKGRRILSCKLFSRGEMSGKLSGCESVGKALDELESEGLLDDGRLAENLAQEYAQKGFSRQGIERKLRDRKIDPKAIERALEGLEIDGDAALSIALKAIRGGGALSLAKLKIRAVRALIARGYSLSQSQDLVAKALSSHVDICSEERERRALEDNLRELSRGASLGGMERETRDQLRKRLISRGFTPSMVDSVMNEEENR